jgi:hypothetical protein
MKNVIYRLIIAISIGGLQMNLCAEALYRIGHLDPVAINAKREHYDKKCIRSQYMRNAGMALLGSWIAYSGYKRFIQQSGSADWASRSPRDHDVAQIAKNVESMQLEIERLKKNVELIKGGTWLAWGGDLMHHVIWGVELATLVKIAFVIGAAPTLSRFLSPLLDVDELWYALRSDVDFVKSINAKARYAVNHRHTDQIEREDLCRMTQDTAILLKKQVERLIGFIEHKQAQYRDQFPHIATQIDDQVHYLTSAFNTFADSLEQLLNEADVSCERLSLSIISGAQQFGEDYGVVKDQLKALERSLGEEEPEGISGY